MRLYFDQVNKAGGVQGQPVELAVLDDVGHPEETVTKTRKLLAGRPWCWQAISAIAISWPCWRAGLWMARRFRWWVIRARIPVCHLTPRMFSTRAGLVRADRKDFHPPGHRRHHAAGVFEERPDAQELTALVTKA